MTLPPPLYPHYSPHSDSSKCGRSLCPTMYLHLHMLMGLSQGAGSNVKIFIFVYQLSFLKITKTYF